MAKESKADKYLRERVYELETHLQVQQDQHESAILEKDHTIMMLERKLSSVNWMIKQMKDKIAEEI